ncbi:MAG: hypothetical protein AB7E32_17165 [Desulfovibrio sp.]
MSKRRANPDKRMVQLTLPLSSLPSQRLQNGSLRTCEGVQDALSRALARCGLSREIVAEEISRLTGHEVSIHTLNNWAAESKSDRPTPLQALAALVAVTGDPGLVEAALAGTGYRLLPPEDVAYYELGRMVAEEKERAKQKRKIWEKIG